jgi:hypothetical protein
LTSEFGAEENVPDKDSNKYYALVKRDAYKVVDTGMLPTEEEMA